MSSACKALSELAMERKTLCMPAAFFFSALKSLIQESQHTLMSDASEFAIMRKALAVAASMAFFLFRSFS